MPHLNRATGLAWAIFIFAVPLGIVPHKTGSAQEAVRSQADLQGKLILGFRMVDWKSQHMHDSAAAKAHSDTLKKLGCEVKLSAHNGHTDVACRTIVWKSMALDNAEQLKQWQTWLNQTGFETLYGHPATDAPQVGPDGKPAEIVKFRLANWKSQHVHQVAELGQLTNLYRSLGCELENLEHAGHTDLRYRCPEWKQIELPNHDAAHKWQSFLNQAGFETSHTH